MTDYGHDLLFGVFVPPLADQHEDVRALARYADELGLELLGVQDHPYQPRFLDTWTLLSTLARETERIRLFPDVINLPLRPPAVLARSSASLDILSGGRVELGLGAGIFWDAIEANGGERRTPGESVEALEEAIAVIRALWSRGGAVRVDGNHYALRGAQPGPLPVHPIGIWIGAYGPRMLRLTGRLADGWVPSSAYLPVSELPAKTRIIDEAARRAGRDPAEIRRVYNVDGDFGLRGDALLQGPPAAWVEPLVDLVLTHGMSAFLLSVSPTATADVRRFAEEVVPAVREAVEHERRRSADAALEAPAVPMAVEPAPVRADEKTGPTERPATDGISAEGRAGQQVLIQVHDHLRNELAQLREGLAQLEAGLHDVEWMRSLLARLTVRTNGCSVGAFCAGYCRFVTLHHAIEDQRLFPDLAGADPALEPVLMRLQQEHEVIAEVIEEIDGALVGMLADPTATGPVRQAVDRLAEVLVQHLSYEEDELLEPIGRLSIVV